MQRKCLKQLIHGGFLEDADAQDLENFVQSCRAAQAFFEQGDQRIDRHRHPELGANGIGAGAVKDLDPQVLFEPAEEQFHLPALLVKPRHRQGGQAKMVGQKHQRAPVLRVVETHPPQLVRIDPGGTILLQADDVVAPQTRGRIDRLGMEPTTAQVFSGANDEPGAGLFDGIEPPPVEVTPVHQVESTGFPGQLIQPKHFLKVGQTDQHLRGQRRVQFELGVNFDAGTFRVETRPGIDRQAQIDDAGVQGVNRLVQIQHHRFVGVKLARVANEVLGQIGEDAPVARGQRVGQRAALDGLAQTQVVELVAAGVETRFDVAQAFAPGQLGKDQTDELLPSGEVLDLVIATVALDAAAKLLWMDEI